MPLSASQICSLARQTAKVRGFTTQSGQFLNAILSELCQEYDFDVAKKTYNFTLSGATTPIGNLNAQLASGPFKLPFDYLRAKIGDIYYFPQGLANFPIKMVPVDLAEFDGLVQQAGFQNFPVFWVTDMSQWSLVTTDTATVTSGSTAMTTTQNPLAASVGMGIAGPGVPPGTTITNISGTTVTMSLAATSTPGSSLYSFGNPPVAYVWPPSSGAYPAMVRYYSQMPDILAPEGSNAVPWFPNQQFLITELSGRLMQLSGDDRWQSFLSDTAPSGSRTLLRRFLELKDDDSNRAKRVVLDGRRFGPAWDRLPKSKVFGY